MYKLVPSKPISLKTYYCADIDVAHQVAQELKERFGCECEIEPMHNCAWRSHLDGLLRVFVLKPGVAFACSANQLEDALRHADGDIVKIKDPHEIFCFSASEAFWQKQYQYNRL